MEAFFKPEKVLWLPSDWGDFSQIPSILSLSRRESEVDYFMQISFCKTTEK